MIEKNDTSINDATNELDDLLRLWSATGWNKHRRYHTALTALVAERNELSSKVGGLRSAMKAQDDRERDAGERCGVSRNLSGCDWPDAVADEVIELKARVAELEARSKPVYFAHGQRLESIDLRERLVESALQGAARDAHMHHEASSMGTRAVYIVDAAIAAMRKGEANGK